VAPARALATGAAPAQEALDPLELEEAAAAPDEREDGAPRAEGGASRALEAEGWFRKGEGWLRRKRYVDAAEAFGMAAHLDPEAGEYRAYLGYALHLANPRNELVRREALEHIAQGIKLSPEREKPLLFLGRVFKAAGDFGNARKVFRRALKIKPECHDAQVELRLLVRAAPKKNRSLLDRLLGR
jgi:cytochrome c-type biogenesis protein CcmH/NrfG